MWSFLVIPQDRIELFYSTIVILQCSILSLFSAREARVLSEVLPNILVMFVRAACSFRCVFSYSPSSLVMLVSGRDTVRDRLTAYARNACCKTFFPKREPRTAYTVCTEARVIRTELQYHFSHETLGNMPACLTARTYVVSRIALLFLSRCN